MRKVFLISASLLASLTVMHKVRGSMAVPMSAECMMRETARRALLLEQCTGL